MYIVVINSFFKNQFLIRPVTVPLHYKSRDSTQYLADAAKRRWRAIHHHQPINVPTAGAQAFVIDYT
jgi:hypothetical protein